MLWPQACVLPGSRSPARNASTRDRNASQPSGARPTRYPRRAALAQEAWAAPAARATAPAATMGKGEGAVDKNMRKELSLEIDGHACPDQYVNVGTGAEITCRAPSTQLTG